LGRRQFEAGAIQKSVVGTDPTYCSNRRKLGESSIRIPLVKLASVPARSGLAVSDVERVSRDPRPKPGFSMSTKAELSPRVTRRECAARADQNRELVCKMQMIKALIFSLSGCRCESKASRAIRRKRDMKQTRTIPETFLGVGYVSDRAGLPLVAVPVPVPQPSGQRGVDPRCGLVTQPTWIATWSVRSNGPPRCRSRSGVEG